MFKWLWVNGARLLAWPQASSPLRRLGHPRLTARRREFVTTTLIVDTALSVATAIVLWPLAAGAGFAVLTTLLLLLPPGAFRVAALADAALHLAVATYFIALLGFAYVPGGLLLVLAALSSPARVDRSRPRLHLGRRAP